MGVYQGNVSDFTSADSNAPFLVLNSSKNDGRYLAANNSIKTLEIKYDSASNRSTFTVNHFDRAQTSNLKTLNLTDYGNWTTILTNPTDLSCALVYENYSRVFRFYRIESNNINLVL